MKDQPYSTALHEQLGALLCICYRALLIDNDWINLQVRRYEVTSVPNPPPYDVVLAVNEKRRNNSAKWSVAFQCVGEMEQVQMLHLAFVN
jgi:hypothetical protein